MLNRRQRYRWQARAFSVSSWHMAHGEILIEIRGGCAYVNGDRVEPIDETLKRGDEPSGER